jgi:hypothetical protein
VSSWGSGRLDVVGLGADAGVWHQSFDEERGGWDAEWRGLGGRFITPPEIVSWGPGRLDVFGLGTDGALYHRYWSGQRAATDLDGHTSFFRGDWFPRAGWESLGGRFTSGPVVASWGLNRLDLFGIGADNAMYHKAWDTQWHPRSGWELLGGGFL